MLEELHVHNFAIIEKLTVRFAEGLNILSGETGAGKSILVGSLLSQRAAKDPATVRIALADMSRVEMPLYERLPHAIAPCAGSVLQILELAQRVEAEMTLRGRLMEADLRVVRPNGSTFDTANRAISSPVA